MYHNIVRFIKEFFRLFYLFLGVYFTSRVEHVKFVDFCGKYRLPLLEFLCSPRCKSQPCFAFSSSESDSEDDLVEPVVSKMQKVLLPQEDQS